MLRCVCVNFSANWWSVFQGVSCAFNPLSLWTFSICLPLVAACLVWFTLLNGVLLISFHFPSFPSSDSSWIQKKKKKSQILPSQIASLASILITFKWRPGSRCRNRFQMMELGLECPFNGLCPFSISLSIHFSDHFCSVVASFHRFQGPRMQMVSWMEAGAACLSKPDSKGESWHL